MASSIALKISMTPRRKTLKWRGRKNRATGGSWKHLGGQNRGLLGGSKKVTFRTLQEVRLFSPLEPLWRPLGGILEALGVAFEASWRLLEGSRRCLGGVLEVSWRALGVSWRCLGGVLEVSWRCQASSTSFSINLSLFNIIFK